MTLAAEKIVLMEAAELALDVLLHCVADGPGVDDPADRQRAIAALKAALAATAPSGKPMTRDQERRGYRARRLL